MPFKKGEPRPEGAGRKPGSKNRGPAGKKLREQLEAANLSLAEEAKKLLADPKASLEFRFQVLAWLAEWSQSKPKPYENADDDLLAMIGNDDDDLDGLEAKLSRQ